MEIARGVAGVLVLIFMVDSARSDGFGVLTILSAILLLMIIVWAILAKKQEDKDWESSEAAQEERARLLSEKGVKAVGEIKGIKKANAEIVRGRERHLGVILEIEVAPETGESFYLTARGLIEELRFSRFQPGNLIDLSYMPDDLTNFSIPNFETNRALTKLIIAREGRL